MKTQINSINGNCTSLVIHDFCFPARHEHGFCQAGFSAAFKKKSNSVLMGAVMGYDQRGIYET